MTHKVKRSSILAPSPTFITAPEILVKITPRPRCISFLVSFLLAFAYNNKILKILICFIERLLLLFMTVPIYVTFVGRWTS